VSAPHIQIIIGSVREQRVGEPIARWFAGHAADRTDVTTELVDLREWNLPFLTQPMPPMRGYRDEITRRWAAKVAEADGYVLVTPEYNHGYPASIKNAIDYLHHEWRYKPVGFVSYGGVAAGTRSVEQLQQVVTAVRLMPVIEQVNIPFYQQFIDDDGVVQANDVMEQAAEAMLDQLVRLEATLRPLREEVTA
jgi:NAD(P)H-dependent FMN reductase